MELNAVYVIVAREFKKFIREKSRLFSAIARPLLWLFIVGAGISRLVANQAGVPYTQFIFPGIIGMTILFSSMFSSISIIWDKEFGFMKEILVAPVSRFSIVIGKALSGTIVSTIQALIILALFPFLGFKLGLLQILEIILICVSLSFCISAFGIVLATFYDSYESFSVIMNFIIMPMFFLSGAMYPVKLLPDILRILAKLNPMLDLTCTWLTPPSWYSIGSSTVIIFFSEELISLKAAYRVVVLPLPVGPVTSMIP